MTFEAFKKIPRLRRNCIITEKIDGTNAQVFIVPITDTGDLVYRTGDNVGEPLTERDKIVALKTWDDITYAIYAGSRKRWITPTDDNYGFAKWVLENADELVKLGEGRHYGEWWGLGVQRGYGLDEKRFSLFNSGRWDGENNPPCTHVVPVLADGVFTTDLVEAQLERLRTEGSVAAPGFDRPEGVIVYQVASGSYAKVLLENDEIPKSVAEAEERT